MVVAALTSLAAPSRAADVNATLPIVTTAPNATVQIPIVINPGLAGLGVRAIQIRMPLNPTYVSNAVWQPTGLVYYWGSAYTNTTSTFTAIASSGITDIASGSLSLGTVELTVAPTAPDADVPLTLDIFRLNATTPTTAVVNGLLRVRGSVGVEDAGFPGLSLAPPAPSPIRREARLAFTLPDSPGRARLEIYSVSGRRVRVLADGVTAPGPHERRWDATDASGSRVPAGVYFLRLEWNGHSVVRRIPVTH
jgi:hypothetical protein